MPQSTKCLPLVQHQTGEAPVGQANRKFCTFLRMFSRASLLDQGLKFNVNGKGYVEVSVGILEAEVLITLRKSKTYDQSQFLQSSSLCFRDGKLKMGGVWNRHTSPCIDLWDDHSILNLDAGKTPGISYVRDPSCHCSTPLG